MLPRRWVGFTATCRLPSGALVLARALLLLVFLAAPAIVVSPSAANADVPDVTITAIPDPVLLSPQVVGTANGRTPASAGHQSAVLIVIHNQSDNSLRDV